LSDYSTGLQNFNVMVLLLSARWLINRLISHWL